mmetsp:Transcript_22119/g.52264  ORF Transcript_22119/g.52264 Transcript_22119/m.52264 type:complete len:239 (-) Transcript_22119:1250-1966(-)
MNLLLILFVLLVGGGFGFSPSGSLSSSAERTPLTSTNLCARPQTRFREVNGNILTRRTVNDFMEELPDGWERALERAIEGAIYAPNHKRTEPWKFYLLGETAIEKVCRLNASLVASKKGEDAGAKKLARWLKMPGWLVVTCALSEGVESMAEPTSVLREDYAACCCAVQNLCLSLHSQGIGTKWTTGPVNFHPDFASAVGFDGSKEQVVGTIWFGTAEQRPTAPTKRKSVEDVLVRVE